MTRTSDAGSGARGRHAGHAVEDLRCLLLGALVACVAVPAAAASEIVDRNATDVKLLVNAKGEALVDYRSHGREKHVLVWGAVNAAPSALGAKQVAFQLDYFGRNIYVDTLDSAYGAGWKRENSFLTHTGTGAFYYSVNPHSPHPAGKGTSYRATVIGPGVTPDVMWQGTAPPAYDRDADSLANDAIAAMGDAQCRPN